ncbi:MAG: universal stress protein, partial [Amnibacterium sp.]
MTERVIVAWDGSPAADGAAEWAARRQGGAGRIELVRVADPGSFPADWITTGGTPEGETLALEQAAARLTAAHPGLTVSTRLLTGHRETELERLSEPGTLLVMGTEARIGSRIRFRFSLALKLAAKSRGPVAVVPAEAVYTAEGPVVVGVVGSAASVAAARLAALVARRRGVGLGAGHAGWAATEWVGVRPRDAGIHDSFEELHRTVLDESLAALARE